MIDPTYLRTLVDGLKSGAFQKGNPSSLPEGLVGVYEEALPPENNVNDRSKFLSYFGVWALLRKEASAAFVASLLEGWTETDVLDWISMYSRWFNSPTAGTFVLYHERFRAFLLQKLSQDELFARNQRIINLGYAALKNRLADEWEHYALEYQSSHLLMASMHTKTVGEELKRLAYDTAHWNRQIELSNEFSWSKRMLKEMLFWSLKHDKDQILECSLNKVDLHYLELNDAPKVVALIAKGEIDLALKRIESFGGSDQEGVRRKFILYMLCLMELTLLESKDQPFRKSGIERILQHLDEQLPTDHSILNWNEFFPSYTMFLMACEWAALDLDYLIVYKRTDDWDKDWIAEKGPYSDLQFEIMMNCARCIIIDDFFQNLAFKEISLSLSKQGNIAKSLSIARDIIIESVKSSALKEISLELNKHGQIEKSVSVMQESLFFARRINDEWIKGMSIKEIAVTFSQVGKIEEALFIGRSISDLLQKSIAMANITVSLSKKGHIAKSADVIQETLSIAHCIINELHKTFALNSISDALWKMGHFDKSAFIIQNSLSIAFGLSSKKQKSLALKDISLVMNKQRQLGKSLSIAFEIPDESVKISTLKNIAIELSQQGQIEESLSIALVISKEHEKSRTLAEIAVLLSQKGQIEESALFMHKSHSIARSISVEWVKNFALKDICFALIKQGNISESVLVIQEMLLILPVFSDERAKILSLKDISLALLRQGNLEESASFILLSLTLARGVSDNYFKINYLKDIALDLSRQGQFEESLSIARSIPDDRYMSIALKDISIELSKHGKIEESLSIAASIPDKIFKGIALETISVVLSKQGQITKSLSITQSISDDSAKCSALKEIAVALIKKGQLEESLSIIDGINLDFFKCRALSEMAELLYQQTQIEVSIKIIQKSLSIARGISIELDKSYALINIAFVLSKQGRADESSSIIQETLTIARGIRNAYEKSNVLAAISEVFCKLGHIEESLSIAFSIPNEIKMCSALKDISFVLNRQGKMELAIKSGLKINQISKRQQYWKDMAKVTYAENGWEKSLTLLSVLQLEEAREYCMKGWAENVNFMEVDDRFIQKALPFFEKDPASLEHILAIYAARKIGLENPNPQSVTRLNQSLNVQWLLDVKNGENGE